MSRTVNRGQLLRMARKGLLELRIRQSLTDDYALDAQLKFGATGWLPAETAL